MWFANRGVTSEMGNCRKIRQLNKKEQEDSRMDTRLPLRLRSGGITVLRWTTGMSLLELDTGLVCAKGEVKICLAATPRYARACDGAARKRRFAVRSPYGELKVPLTEQYGKL